MNPNASVLMMPFSTLYRAITRARLAAYRSGLFLTSKLPATVISVGNITAGGTGKTPLVEWVCRTIADSGPTSASQDSEAKKRICVLTRGYGKSNPKDQVLVSNGSEMLAGEREAGDEPSLLAYKLMGIAAVISNPNRVAAGEWAIRNLGTEVFVLDDGFQHLRLDRDLDIVTIDATNPWSGGELLPGGRLREPIEGLSRTDCVVITRSDQAENLASIKATIRQLVGDVPIFSSRMITTGLRSIDRESLIENLSQPIGAFCGVGNPESFFTHLRRDGFDLVFSRSFPDHYRYSPADLDTLVTAARESGAQALITTAKDATKLRGANLTLPTYVLEIEISIEEQARLAAIIRNTISKPSV